MTSNVAVKITADVTDLQTKMMLARAEANSTSKEFTKLYNTMRASGSSEFSPQMLQAAQAAGVAKGEVSSLSSQLAKLGESISHGSFSTGIREVRAAFDELSSGRTRMLPGTLAIIATKVLGLSPALLGATVGVAALAAGLVYLGVKSVEAQQALDKLQNVATFAGNFSLTRAQLQATEQTLEQFAGVSSKDAQQIVASFARMRDQAAPEMDALARTIGQMAQVTGEKAPEAAKALIAALDSEKLSAGELVKLFPNITQAQIDNIQATQRMGDAHKTAVQILDLVNDALEHSKQGFIDQRSAIDKGVIGWVEMVSVLASGMTMQDAQRQSVTDATKAWNANEKAIRADLDALQKLSSVPPPHDLIDPMQKAEAALAHLDATWKGSTVAREQAEAQLWQNVARQAGLSDEQRMEATKRADEAIFRSHEALASQSLKADKQSNEEQLRALEESAQMAAKGSAEQIAALEKLYQTAVRLDGARSSQAISAERQLYAAKGELAKEWLGEIAAVDAQAVQKANESAKEEIAAIKQEYSEKQINAAQEIALLEEVEARRYQLAQNSLQTELAVWAGYPDKLKEINKQIEDNETSHQKTLDSIIRDGTKNLTQEYEQAYAPILNGFNSMVDGILRGNESMSQILRNTAAQMAEDWIRQELRQVEQTVLSEQAKTQATIIGNAARSGSDQASAAQSTGFTAGKYVAQIEADAAKTYADVFAWAAPSLGPFAAVPAAAAALLVGAQAALIPSFAVGTNYVPSNTLAMVHQGERIIPAADNSALMSALGAGGGGGDNYNITVQVPPGVTNPTGFGNTIGRLIAQQVRLGNSNLKTAFSPA